LLETKDLGLCGETNPTGDQLKIMHFIFKSHRETSLRVKNMHTFLSRSHVMLGSSDMNLILEGGTKPQVL